MSKALLFSLLILSSNFVSAKVSFEQFLKLKVAITKSFNDLRPNIFHSLSINTPIPGFNNYWWNLEEVHASYSGIKVNQETKHSIFLFGGLARLEGQTLDGLALTACHELGHGLGGAPHKSNGSSTEGQSDYYATKVCLPIVFKYLKQTTALSNDQFIAQSCKTNMCKRVLSAVESSINFFQYLGDYTSFQTPSLEVSYILNHSPTYYPSSQCRLDTYVAGALGKRRPKCWYPHTEEQK